MTPITMQGRTKWLMIFAILATGLLAIWFAFLGSDETHPIYLSSGHGYGPFAIGMFLIVFGFSWGEPSSKWIGAVIAFQIASLLVELLPFSSLAKVHLVLALVPLSQWFLGHVSWTTPLNRCLISLLFATGWLIEYIYCHALLYYRGPWSYGHIGIF